LTSANPRQKMLSKPHSILLAFLLAIATFAVYYPVQRLPFINYDDDLYVTENVHVQSGLEWDTVQWAFTTRHASNWHPLTWVSHALDFQLFHLDPAGPHVVNLLLHTSNVVLLFWVLWRAAGYAGRSAMVAALFALHPINVQSVAWVAERKNLLSMLFFLLALGAYRWYVSGPRIGRYFVMAILFAFGLMAKPQIITLPLVLLLWDYWPLGRMAANAAAIPPTRNFSWLVWEKLPLFVLAAASARVTLLAHSVTRTVRWLPLSMRVANALLSCARYVKLAFWPSRLALFYPHPLVSLTTWEVLASAVFLFGVTVLVIEGGFSLFAVWSSLSTEGAQSEKRRAKSRYLLVGWFWFLITLLPMVGLIQVGTQGMADRYAYLPLIGLFIMFVWGVGDWADQRHIPVKWQTTAGVAVLLALSVVTRCQLDYWRDSVTLWTHTLEVTHGNYIAEVDLGAELVKRGDFLRAMEHFRAATVIDPQDPLANMYIARYAQMQNNLPEAIEAYKKVIASTPDPNLKARAYNNLGYAYRALGDEAEAQMCFRAAASLGY
jgi:protein O-mannosyl-transferase